MQSKDLLQILTNPHTVNILSVMSKQKYIPISQIIHNSKVPMATVYRKLTELYDYKIVEKIPTRLVTGHLNYKYKVKFTKFIITIKKKSIKVRCSKN